MSCHELATESEFRWTLATGVLRGGTLRCTYVLGFVAIFLLLSPAQVPPYWCTSVRNRAPRRPRPCSRSYTCSVERSESSSKDLSLNNPPTSFTLEEKTKGSPLSGVWIDYVDEAVVFLWCLCPVQPCSGGTRTLGPPGLHSCV